VISYTLRLFDLPGEIRTSTLAFALSRTAEVVPYLRQTSRSLPANVEMIMVMANAPPPLREHAAQVLLVSAVGFAQTPEEAERILAPIDECPVGEPLLKQTQVPGTFETLFELMDQTYRKGRRYAADTLWLAGDPTSHLRAAAELFKEVPGRESHFLAVMVPPPPADSPGLPDAAFSLIAPLFLAGYSIWEEPDDDEVNIAWLRAAMDRFASSATGHYVGEADLRTGPDKAAGCFAAPNWQRLCALKKRYDPDNLFRWFAENQ
jgi:FAD/FMN-containing dehydrogenase